MKPYAIRLAAYGFFMLLSVIFTMATALSVADFLKILFPTDVTSSAVPANDASLLSQGLQQLYMWLISFGPKHALVYFSIILLGLYSLKNVFGYLSVVQMAVVRCNIVRDIRGQLYRKAMRLPLSYYSKSRRGDILSRFAGDMTEYGSHGVLLVEQVFSLCIGEIQAAAAADPVFNIAGFRTGCRPGCNAGHGMFVIQRRNPAGFNMRGIIRTTACLQPFLCLGGI